MASALWPWLLQQTLPHIAFCTGVIILTCKHPSFFFASCYGYLATNSIRAVEASKKQYIPSLNEMHSSVLNF